MTISASFRYRLQLWLNVCFSVITKVSPNASIMLWLKPATIWITASLQNMIWKVVSWICCSIFYLSLFLTTSKDTKMMILLSKISPGKPRWIVMPTSTTGQILLMWSLYSGIKNLHIDSGCHHYYSQCCMLPLSGRQQPGGTGKTSHGDKLME